MVQDNNLTRAKPPKMSHIDRLEVEQVSRSQHRGQVLPGPTSIRSVSFAVGLTVTYNLRCLFGEVFHDDGCLGTFTIITNV